MNGKIQKKKYHDIKKLFGKEYFKSYFIKPKVHLSLSPSSSNRFQSDTKKNEIISTINSSNNLSSKIDKDTQIIKISKNKSNTNYFKLTKQNKKSFKKSKILKKTLINKSNNNLGKNNKFNVYNNYISTSKKIDTKFNYDSNNNTSTISNGDYMFNKIIKNIKIKQGDMNIKKNKNNNKKILCDSIFKLNRENKIKLKNYKNINKIKLKNKNNKNILKLDEINNKDNKENKESIKINSSIMNTNEFIENNKPYLNTIESNTYVKKIKINNILNYKKFNKNKSCESLYKKKFSSKNKKNRGFLKKKDIKYILFNSKNNSHSLYSEILSNIDNSNNLLKTERSKNIKNKTNNNNIKKNKSTINNYCYKNKNKSIDVNNSNNSYRNKFFIIIEEQRKKLREEEFKKNMDEIKKNSICRKNKYIQLFNKINKYLFDIQKIIEQIEKEDLLKDITSKINDETILNNENSISIEQKFKSFLNNGLFSNINARNNTFVENTTSVIYNDFTFEEDKKDISLKSIDIKKNSLFENTKVISNSKNNNDNCFIF